MGGERRVSLSFNIMQDALLENVHVAVAIKKLNDINNSIDDYDNERNPIAYRVCRSLGDITKKENSWWDFCGNLRQAILFYNRILYISKEIYIHIKDIIHHFKLICNMDSDEQKVEVQALKKMPAWFDKGDSLNDLYKLIIRRETGNCIGDWFLYNFTGFRYYKSNTQKNLVKASMTMSEGSTLLGCMSTGEGKSLVGLMPGYYEEKGTTIIIVPTISLAIDQNQNANKLYKNRKYKPKAYHSGLEYQEREDIITRLADGNLPVLFISPEALLNSKFNKIVLEVAKKGILRRLVIDEAHIVEDWGGQFRTEFQFLSMYRRRLLEVSNNKIKTILLSATFTEHSTNILKELFSEGDNYIEIKGDALRPEIQYYIQINKSIIERLSKLKEIIPLLPRPIIIYVIKPDDALQLEVELKKLGFKSVFTFTGIINSRTTRETILEQWNDNNIDIMIATSAFGMGVDKKDIRTVIHYCIPESINRFYQEVGRGGRDGAPSISLMMTMPSEDMKNARYLINSKALTIDKFIDRWETMKGKVLDRIDGNTIVVDTNLKPSYIEDEKITGKPNASWNEYVILQLFRNGFIDILDMEVNEKGIKHIKIRIEDFIVDDLEKLRDIMEGIREEDVSRTNESLSRVKELATKDRKNRCIAHELKSIYRNTVLSCGGCYYCRKNNFKPYIEKNYTEYNSGRNLIENYIKSKSNSKYEGFLSIKNNLILFYETDYFSEDIIIEIFEELLEKEVDSIIIKDRTVYEKIKFDGVTVNSEKFFDILTLNELEDNYNELIISGTIAIIYDENFDKNINRELYKYSQEWEQKGNKIIHILNNETEIIEGKKLINDIDGTFQIIGLGGVSSYGV